MIDDVICYDRAFGSLRLRLDENKQRPITVQMISHVLHMWSRDALVLTSCLCNGTYPGQVICDVTSICL